MEFQEIEAYKAASRWFTREDHYYVVNRTRGQSMYLRCASDRCPAHWTLSNGQAGPVVGEHDHEPTPWVPNRNAMFQALKRRARDDHEHTPLNRIYEEEAARYPDAAPHMVYEAVEPSMRKWRRSTQPAVPRTLQDLANALANHHRHSHMLLATVSAGGASAIILVMPNYGMCLRDSSTAILDGTFQTVPAGLEAYQILTIHAVIEGCFFHPVIVLMQNRRRVLYEAVLQRLWQAAGNPAPPHIVTDFEPALQAALEAVTGVQVQGCLFHFVQALLRRARQLGIPVARNSPGWRLVQLYGALALLPPAQVPLGLAELRAIAAAQGLPFHDEFHDYFVAQWMIRVGPEAFSVYQSPHRTSNVAESFHASLARSLGPAPNVWRFADFFWSLEYGSWRRYRKTKDVISEKFAVSAARLEALRAGDLPRRNRERSYIRTTVIANDTRALERGIITLREFLVATSRNMDVGVGVVVDADAVPEIGAELEVFEPVIEVNVQQEDIEIEVNVQQEDIHILPAPDAEVAPPRPASPPPPPALLCNICVANVPTLVLQPCGHPLCTACRQQVQRCPFCRTEIRDTVRLYLP